MNNKYQLGFIGCGKMATALATGIIKNKTVSNKHIYATDVDEKHLVSATKKLKIKALKNNIALAKQCNIIVLAVKPFHMNEVLQEIKDHVMPETLILSIAAGIPLRALNIFKKKVYLARVMPNTPAMLGAGISGIYFNRNVPATLKKLTHQLLLAVGSVVEVKQEKQMDAITALSGSGPAFVYHFIEALISGGVKAGLSPALAKQLSLATLLGATKMISTTGLSPAELITQVTSKKGTTLAGLDYMKKNNFFNIVEQTILAAYKRAMEISVENQ